MTNELAETLQLTRKRCSIPVRVLNSLCTTCYHTTAATIQSRHTNLTKSLTFFVIPTISDFTPREIINRKSIQIPSNIKLADPNFHKPAPVQMLIGAGPTLSFLSIGQINLSPSTETDLILQKTQLGWVLGGDALSKTPETTNRNQPTCHVTELQFELDKFWRLEECISPPHLSMEEIAAEKHFKANTVRSANGRYVVALPFKENVNRLGESRTAALKRFHALEKRLESNPWLREQYTAVIQEYLDLGHMSVADSLEQPGFYLPHHAVTKERSQTTKVRVVFDGSAKSNTNVSLNDTLMIGPHLQDDIFSLILRFRL